MKRDIPQELPFDFCENCIMYDPKIDSAYLYGNDEKIAYSVSCRCSNEVVCRNVERLLNKQDRAVVHCKDCKYHECTDVCEMHGSHTEEHEFCSRGERDDNEGQAVKWE